MSTERFELGRELGRGGMGVVYEALDRRRQLRVALKTMKRSNAAALLQFKREFRALTRVVHRNLVRLFELVADGDDWFFTMELVEGVDFLRHVRPDLAPAALRTPAPTETSLRPALLLAAQHSGPEASEATMTSFGLRTAETMDSRNAMGLRQDDNGATWADLLAADDCSPLSNEERLRTALAQLADGVDALHQRGLLHRDIKPLNVLVEADGRVVVLDFGLVTALRGSANRIFAGTPRYMAPEQFAPDYVPGPATDWYAVGMMLHEALIGARPTAATLSDLAHAKRRGPPPMPSELGVPAPADLEQLCRGLLEVDPDRRLAGPSVVEALGVSRPQNLRRQPRVSSSPASLFGRSAQFQLLRDAFDRSQAGTGNTIYVQGKSGTGKTALVDAFLDAVSRDTGAVVLRGRCYERESVPYKAVDSLIDSLSEHLIDAPLPAQEWPTDLDALVTVFPVLRRVDFLESIPEVDHHTADAHDLRRRAFGALRDLLASVGRTRPTVLFIDDLQWGDLDSAPLLDQLMRPPHAPALLLVASYRSEEVERSPLLAALLRRGQRLGPASAVSHVEVGPLAQGPARGLAQSLLDNASSETVDAVVRESGGHPYFLRELCRAVIERADGQLAPASINLDDVLAERVSRLAPAARTVLLATALCGRPTSIEVVLAAADERGQEHTIVPLLEDEQLVRVASSETSSLIECFHDRVRETVSNRATDDESRRMHRSLGEAFAAAGEDSETLARHFHQAGDISRAAVHALDAAAAAESTFAFDRAAELYRVALEAEQDESIARSLERALGDALVRAGRGSEAADVYRELAERFAESSTERDQSEAFGLRRLAAFEYLKAGRLDEGLVVIERLMGEVGLAMPKSPLRALPGLAVRRAQVALRGTGFEPADDTGVRRAAVLERADICWAVGVGLGMVDTFRAAYFQTRGLLLALESGDPYRVGRALCLESAILAVGSDRARVRAYRLLGRAKSLADELDEPALHAWVAGARSFVHHQAGRFRKGRDDASAAVHILREHCPGLTWEAMSVDLYLLWALHGLGEIREMTARVSVLVEDARSRGDLYALANLRTGLCSTVWLAADAPGEARSGAEHAVASWTHKHGFHLQHYWALYTLAQCDLYEGHFDSAADRVRRQWAPFRRSLLLSMKAVHIEAHDLRARVNLAAAAHHPGSAAWRRARRDARILARSGLPWGRALAALVRAGVAGVRNRPEAETLYEQAAARLRKAGMQQYAHAASFRAAQYRGDTARQREALDWFRGQGVVEPERFLAVFAPVSPPRPLLAV